MGTESVPKTEEAAECPSPLELQIIRQIEYYFGNYNLSRDKYLKEELQKDDGWVPLENMVKFNRLKKLSEDFKVIADALKKSPKQLMEVNEDNTKIRRRVAPVLLPENTQERYAQLDERTLYAKGFKRNNTFDEILEFFQAYPVENVLMRRNFRVKDKPFKGSVFATFETKEAAEDFLNTKGIKYNGVELLKEFKKDYVKRKDEQFKTIREERELKRAKKAAEGLTDEKKEENKKEADDENPDMVRGCLLRLKNLDKDCMRENIKEVFDPLGTLVYVDYHQGNPSGVLRFETAVASSVLEKIDEVDGEKKIDIGSSKAVVTAVEGDEETEYWKFISKSRSKSRQFSAEKRRFAGGNRSSGNRGRFKNWGRGKRGKKEDKEDDGEKTEDTTSEPPQKKLKVENAEENSEKPPAVTETMKVEAKVES